MKGFEEKSMTKMAITMLYIRVKGALTVGRQLIALTILSASIASAGDLTFIAGAVNPGNGKQYKAYIDQSTKHREGAYETVKLVSIYEKPISAAGYDGVKSMINTFQADCPRHVKRLTYIAFLNSEGQVVVDEKYPDAKDEPFGENTVDQKILPYLCPAH
jgi:hypothetical protein